LRFSKVVNSKIKKGIEIKGRNCNKNARNIRLKEFFQESFCRLIKTPKLKVFSE